MIKKCRVCKTILSDKNWGVSNQKQGNYICNKHYNEYKRKLKREHKIGKRRRPKKPIGYSSWLNNDLVTFIPLTKGKYAIVDIEDGEKLINYKWQCSESRNTNYARRKIYLGNRSTGKFMHHEILPIKNNLMCDHINGNGLDNRKKNLRLVTNRENSQNHVHKKYSSKFPGVCWDKHHQKWQAYIRVGSKQITLGRKDSEEEAYNLYLKELSKLL